MSVGMPEALYLDEFASKLIDVFDVTPYHVGSSATQKSGWRDVDVRVILSDEKYKEMFCLDNPAKQEFNAKWVALCLAFSELGKRITGLPIDFQIQQQTYANNTYKGTRFAIGMTPVRMAEYRHTDTPSVDKCNSS